MTGGPVDVVIETGIQVPLPPHQDHEGPSLASTHGSLRSSL
jgi:hypothetical protein